MAVLKLHEEDKVWIAVSRGQAVIHSIFSSFSDYKLYINTLCIKKYDMFRGITYIFCNQGHCEREREWKRESEREVSERQWDRQSTPKGQIYILKNYMPPFSVE